MGYTIVSGNKLSSCKSIYRNALIKCQIFILAYIYWSQTLSYDSMSHFFWINFGKQLIFSNGWNENPPKMKLEITNTRRITLTCLSVNSIQPCDRPTRRITLNTNGGGSTVWSPSMCGSNLSVSLLTIKWNTIERYFNKRPKGSLRSPESMGIILTVRL